MSRLSFFKYGNYLEANKSVLSEMLDLCYSKSLPFDGIGEKKPRKEW